MPLPPRDMSMLHLSMNPALADMHARYPLSRYVPAVGVFKLYKLAFDGIPLVHAIDEATWLTLACLDDAAADFCINQAAQAMAYYTQDKNFVNTTMVHCAAPFLVPMMVPMVPSVPPAAPPPAPPPPPPPPTPERPRQTHVSESKRTLSKSAVASTASTRSCAGSAPPAKTVLQSNLPATVLRSIFALLKESAPTLDMNVFDENASRMRRLDATMACKALREFSARVAGAVSMKEASKMLSDVLIKYES